MQGSGAHRTARSTYARTRGFTLVELMIVVVIVSILMAIAIPTYSSFMKRSRRGDAEAILMDIAQRQQQYLNDARAYAPNWTAFFPALPVDVSSYYTVTVCGAAPPAACGAPGGAPPFFVIVATPIATSPQAGDYTLTLDSTGVRGPANAW